MTVCVIDGLEPVDVDESKQERGAGTVRTLELPRNLLETELSRPGARQFVCRGELQVVGRLGAFTGCVSPVVGGPCPVVRCLGAIGRRPRPVALGPQENVLPARVRVVVQVMQTSQRVTPLCATIATFRCPITIGRRLHPRVCTLGAQIRNGNTISAGSLARHRASVMGSRVTTGRQIIVRGLLILVRTSLVALTGGLVVIRPGLILITRGLVAITRRLIAFREVIIRLVNGELCAAGGTPRNRGRLAAGWALHNLFHHRPHFPSPCPGR